MKKFIKRNPYLAGLVFYNSAIGIWLQTTLMQLSDQFTNSKLLAMMPDPIKFFVNDNMQLLKGLLSNSTTLWLIASFGLTLAFHFAKGLIKKLIFVGTILIGLYFIWQNLNVINIFG